MVLRRVGHGRVGVHAVVARSGRHDDLCEGATSLRDWQLRDASEYVVGDILTMLRQALRCKRKVAEMIVDTALEIFA